MQKLNTLVQEIKNCRICAESLPFGARPVFQFSASSRVLIAGQAPGRKVHESGIPFKDASGQRLRDWLGISETVFYDANRVAVLPMGFCYPGTGKSGDLPPRPECAATWRDMVLQRLKKVKLTIVLGQYAIDYHLPAASGTLTDIVYRWREQGGNTVALPHPSPRNNLWLKRNPWFEAELIPELRRRVAEALSGAG